MRRSSGYHSFPMFGLSFVMIGCGLVVLSLEFGWIQIEFDEQDTGQIVNGKNRIHENEDLKMLKTIDITIDTTGQSHSKSKTQETHTKDAPILARGAPEAYPSRSELIQRLPAPTLQHTQATTFVEQTRPLIEVLEYVEGERDPSATFPGNSQNVTIDQKQIFPAQLGPEEKRPFLNGTDLDGRFHRFGEQAGVLATTVVFLSPDCSFSAKYISQLNRMASVFQKKGIKFYGVISNRTTTRQQALTFRRKAGIGFPLLFDTSGVLRAQLRPTHTTQVFVIDPEGTLLYTGRIDDRFVETSQRRSRSRQHHLTRVLQSVTSGKEIRVTKTEPVGCLMEPSAEISSEFPVTYAREIAPILRARCARCHRPGEATPFSLTTYEEALQRARQINLVTNSRYMPPWKPVEGVGLFRHESRLTNREIQLIALWAKSGAPHGNPSELPPSPSLSQGWQLGRPDMIIRIPETVHLRAERDDVFQYFVIPSGLVQDGLVSAVEFRPGNADITEQMVLYCDTTGQARELDRADSTPGYQRVGGPGFQPSATLGRWFPGSTSHQFPSEIGRRIPAHSDLVLEIHYRPSGKTELDRPRLGIHFATGKIRRASTEILVANPTLQIPSGDPDYRHTASYRLPIDVTFHSISPHLRRLGKGIKVTARLPDESEIPLLSIEDWDFKWQNRYLFRRPIRLPRGTRIEFETLFDNSQGNPYNPHSPPQDVLWGDRAVDETALCFFDVTTDLQVDLYHLKQHNQQHISRQKRQSSQFE